MAEHDQGYKRLFSHPEMVADLLRGFVREDWVRDLDFSSLEKFPGSFVVQSSGFWLPSDSLRASSKASRNAFGSIAGNR